MPPRKYTAFIKCALLFCTLGLGIFLCFSTIHANQDLISLFPIENYNQNVDVWIQPGSADYDKPLLSPAMQQHHFEVFYNHYFGPFSPWDAGHVNQIIHKAPPDDLQSIEQGIMTGFTNQAAANAVLGYGANFRPYSPDWIADLANNINIAQLAHLDFQVGNRAIAIDNLAARALPTEDVYFYSHKLAGEGYPFDNLQMSSVWAGTPLYVLAETRDRSWSLVLTPEFIGWVKTNGLAYANEAFVNHWKAAAKKNLAAIIHSQTSLFDESGQFRFSAYVGSVFPAEPGSNALKIMLPVMDADHHALIKYGPVSSAQAVLMPLLASPEHFSQLIHSLIGRPYGWGGLYFYNDCSAELKNLLAPFGIWLPRHSSDQVYAGKMIDMTAATPEQRVAYLIANGHRFLTIVYIGGHVLMYIGNYANPNNKDIMALSYQNIWGLSPNPPIRRAVIGKAVLFPLLLQYPEDSSLSSLASKKYFQMAYLDELPNYSIKLESVDLRALMSMN